MDKILRRRVANKNITQSGTENFKDVYKLLKSLNITKKINTPESASSMLFKKNEIIGKKLKILEKMLKL